MSAQIEKKAEGQERDFPEFTFSFGRQYVQIRGKNFNIVVV